MSEHSTNRTVVPNKNLRIIFAGTPDIAASVLSRLIDENYSIVAAYCQPDRGVGRGKKLSQGPVKKLALSHNIPVEQPINFKSEEALKTLQNYHADLMIVIAYGLILPKSVLQQPPLGCVNIHASILPRWRGAAPIQRAIEAGDTETGITLMQMDEGLDTGNSLFMKTCAIEAEDTGSHLHDKLAALGADCLSEWLTSNEFITHAKAGKKMLGEPQNHSLANYAHKLTKNEAEVNWLWSASTIERKIRAFNSWPVAFTKIAGKRLRLWQAEALPKNNTRTKKFKPGQVIKFDKSGIDICCGDYQAIRLLRLQAEGSKQMSASELLNSRSEWFSDHPILGN